MALPRSFVRPSAEDQLSLARTFSLPGQRSGRARRIFVIKKTSRLRSTNGADKKIRRILIFDNHPDSLRLVFEGGAISHHELPKSRHVSSWELIIVCSLTVVGLIGMFWPLF
ncbi:MAG: hypothetical protein DMF26_12275 [Verrucomicrobia bacterium]|nr:MAG: hypothetical protein DMF26_12275 [Verrucomicrobiota bacterium]